MENIFEALEMGVGIIIFCIGLHLLINMKDLFFCQYDIAFKEIYKNHLVQWE